MKKRTEKKSNLDNIRKAIIFLDVIIALLIILTAQSIFKTDFGKASLTFGFVMILLVTFLKMTNTF